MRIHLNRKYYSREAIQGALDAFKEACEGEIVTDEFSVELKTGEEEQLVADEFANYVLSLEIERRAGV